MMMMGMMVMVWTSTRSSSCSRPACRIADTVVLARSRQQPVVWWLRRHIGTGMVARMLVGRRRWPMRMMVGRVGRLLLRLLRLLLLPGVLGLRRRLLLLLPVRRRRMPAVLLRRVLRMSEGATAARTGR